MRALLRKPGLTVPRNYAPLMIKISLALAWGQKSRGTIHLLHRGRVAAYRHHVCSASPASPFITSRCPHSHQDDRDMFFPKQLLSLAVFSALATFISALTNNCARYAHTFIGPGDNSCYHFGWANNVAS